MAGEDQVTQEGQDGTQVQEAQYTEAETLAMEKGWRPKEEYDGDPANFRSAELFLQLDPLYKKLDAITRENKQLKDATQYLTKLQKETKANEYKRALTEFKAQRRAAMEDGDYERADLIDEQIDTIKEQASIVADTPEVDTAREGKKVFNEWQERNTWYTKDEDLKAWADGRGLQLHGQGKSPDEVLSALESEVKKKFPSKFSNPNRERASAVEGSAGRAASAPKKDEEQLTDMERKVANTLIRAGAVKDMAEYIAQLKTAK